MKFMRLNSGGFCNSIFESFPKIETGEVKPTICRVLPITEAEAAQALFYQGQSVGKVVLTVRKES